MIEPLRPKQSLKAAELQDGDIICFQQATERKAGQPEKPSQDPANKTTDRFEDVREYYDFLEHKRNVKFLPHPTRGEASQFEPFELVLNSKINYDTLSERVGSELGVPATHIRFWTVNVATNNPKAPVRRGTNPSLRQILHPMGANTFTSSQRNDSFFLEVLDMSLAEFDTKKNIKVTWLSEGITKEVG
jgi:ubiquitin carboxyl-terminal hydrolase 7